MELKQYDHIFFDLDRTLWDFDTNSHEAMEEIYSEFKLFEIGIPEFGRFHDHYKRFNDAFWIDYRDGKVEKEVLRWIRFYKTFEMFGIQDKNLSLKISEAYIQRAPRKQALIEGVQELLELLHPRYPLHIITNGFSEIQHVKLTSGGILHYFKEIINSENACSRKPSREIYEYARHLAGATDPSRCLMVGDDYIADVKGAIAAGWDAIWFNPSGLDCGQPVRQIRSMKELLTAV
jgi:YjjG family noncanonical pyrimidine nucleotidase